MSSAVKGDHVHFPAIRPGASQKVSFTGSSVASSNAVASGVTLIRLFATENCWVVFGSSPTAVANNGSSFYLPSNVVEYFGVSPGDKVAAIRDTTSGDLHITEAK